MEKDFTRVNKVHDNIFKARCTVCRKEFSISHGRVCDLRQHEAGGGHAHNCRTRRTNQAIQLFFVPERSPEADKITAPELANVYHTVKHNMSYNSTDCALKLAQKMFSDSYICKRLACGRTKSESLVKDVLAPKAVADFIQTFIHQWE
ncbi:hypothetical protein HHUSO_G3049 [Huso huso]|uniref:C2H2-type domain-containing protein n=1 Tax=Huso huso TaxID=61971 RepID=A0ABR1A9Y5_HUSHU